MRAATWVLNTVVLVGAVAFLGCDEVDMGEGPVTTAPDAATNDTDNTVTAPDNTDVNERDADGDTKTPIDQDETQRDVNITSEIRQRILNTEGMSINARNAKVITAGGKVTLRGPVESAEERDTIDKIAREVAGADNVDNQLEVAGEAPATPSADTPATPDRPTVPETPDPENTPAPGASDSPALPETPAPETPAAPETPEAETPEAPAAETPAAPETPVTPE